MAEIKLVAESFEEYTSKPGEKIEGEINEGVFSSPKALLQEFLKDPEKNQESFVAAYAKQSAKVKGLKDSLAKMKVESKKFLAQQSIGAMGQDSNLVVPWIKVEGGKIKGATALALKGKNLTSGE